MDGRHCAVRRPAVQSLIGLGVLFTFALVVSAPSAATSAVTIGGPFTLSTADGVIVTDQTYRGKWLLVYFGYTGVRTMHNMNGWVFGAPRNGCAMKHAPRWLASA